MKNQREDRGKERRSEAPQKAGNAARDPNEQTLREDLPPDSQERGNEPARGTAPPLPVEPSQRRGNPGAAVRGDQADDSLAGDVERSGR